MLHFFIISVIIVNALLVELVLYRALQEHSHRVGSFLLERVISMFDTWTPKQREAAIEKGLSGGQLGSYDRHKLEELSQQAGALGQRAKDALDKSKK